MVHTSVTLAGIDDGPLPAKVRSFDMDGQTVRCIEADGWQANVVVRVR